MMFVESTNLLHRRIHRLTAQVLIARNGIKEACLIRMHWAPRISAATNSIKAS